MTNSSDKDTETPPNKSTETPPDGRSHGGISDEQLPEDLRPTEDNPLAQDPDEQEMKREREDAAGPAADRVGMDQDDDGQAEGEPPGAVPRPPNA